MVMMAAMTYDPRKHHRRSIRLKGYDYTQAGAYFVTIVTHDRECLFGEVVDGVMRLNAFGEIVREEWFRTAVVRPYVMLAPDEFVVMPNHIHGIIWITGGRGDPVGRPYDPVGRPYDPVGRPYDPVGRPYDPVGRPYDPVGRPHDPVGRPHDPVGRPYDPVGRPHDPVGRPHDPVGRPHDPMGRPHDPVGRPYDPVGRPHDPVGRPYDPVGRPHDNDRDDQRPHGPAAGSVGAIIGQIKSITAKRINALRGTPAAPVWGRNYYEHIIRYETSLNRIRRYIAANPSRWAEDHEHPRHPLRRRAT
jgi:putative transposase